MADEGEGEWRFSGVVKGHSADVKCLAVDGDGRLFSGSRDGSIAAWDAEALRSGEPSGRLAADEGRAAVNALAVYRAGGLLLCGDAQGAITAYSLADAAFVTRVHKAHADNVCSLWVDESRGVLLSGSWDCEARVWRLPGGEEGVRAVADVALVGHRAAVWSAVALPSRENAFVTASADRLIRVWNGPVVELTLKGHEDVVRVVAFVCDARLVSCSNDSTVRLWDIDSGECLQTVQSSHGNFIYSLALVGESGMATAGEGGALEVAALTAAEAIVPTQQLCVPTSSVWSLAALHNGDIACAASDGQVWLFTRAAERTAGADAMSAYDAAVAQQLIALEETQKKAAAGDEGVVTIKVALEEGAADKDLRYRHGELPWDAAAKFTREHNLPDSYIQQVAEFIEQNVPSARGLSRPETKHTHKGQQWDYLFDVSLEDGKALKCAYNTGEDPWMAAQRFIQQNDMPIEALGQMAQFIKSQVPSAVQHSGAQVDPFTGDGAYVPGRETTRADATGEGDPFTGAGRYVPASAAATHNGAVDASDPFTGGGRYVPSAGGASTNLGRASGGPGGAAVDRRRPRGEHVPLREYVQFGREGASAKFAAKLREANDAQSSADARLADEQLDVLAALMTTDELPADADERLIGALQRALTWNIEHLVPPLDAFRLALLRPAVQQHFVGRADALAMLHTLLRGEPSAPIRIVVCRALANVCAHSVGRAALLDSLGETLALVAPCIVECKPAVQTAAAAVLANGALVLLRERERTGVEQMGPREDFVRLLMATLGGLGSASFLDQRALLLVLQAVATVLWGDGGAVAQAKELGATPVVAVLKDATQDDAGKAIARDIDGMLYAW